MISIYGDDQNIEHYFYPFSILDSVFSRIFYFYFIFFFDVLALTGVVAAGIWASSIFLSD